LTPKGHVPGADDGGVAGGGLDLRQVLGFKAGGADDVDGAGLGGQRGEFHGGGGGGEVDDGLGFRESLKRVVGDFHANRAAPHRLAHVAADPGVARAFDAGHEAQLVRGLRQTDQRLPHAARGPRYHQSRLIHLPVPRLKPP
jgi:hypothetical protein